MTSKVSKSKASEGNRKKRKASSVKAKTAAPKRPRKKSVPLAKSLRDLSKAIDDPGTGIPMTCDNIESKINEYLNDARETMHNALGHCDDEKSGCGCGGEGGSEKIVDLVVLLDSSGSMSGAGKAVSDAAVAAVEAAAVECPSDLRVSWFVVDGSKSGADPAGDLGDITATLAGTPFTQSHQQYLEGIGATGPFKQDEPQPAGDVTYPGEEGADSIADICNFYDWRPNACRSIFYISDTMLDGYSAFYVAAATNATAAATANGVVLFAHKIGGSTPAIKASYDNMTDPTGGSTYHGPVDSNKYIDLIKNAICNACGSECKPIELPEMKPCVEISWGNSECDCLETDDVEIAYISMCNCYSNIQFSNVHISYFEIVMEDGSPVPTLPDGTPSVQITPTGPICFGDLAPCKEGETNCVTREVVLRTRGAKGGKYKLKLYGICYDVNINQMHNDCFALTLCQD